MSIEKQEEKQEEKLPDIYDKSIKVLTDGGLDNDRARNVIIKCYEKFQAKIAPDIVEEACVEYIKQNPAVGKGLDEADEDLIYYQLANIFLEKLSTKSSARPKLLYTGPGGIKITESSNN